VIFFLNFLNHAFKTQGNETDEFVYLLIALAIIVPMSFLNNMVLFSKFSLIANICIALTLIYVLGHNIHIMINTDVLTLTRSNLFNFRKIPLMIGVAFFNFEAIGVIIPIRNSI